MLVAQPDVPLTPFGRQFLQPNTEQITNSAIFFQSPIDIPTFKSAVESSPLAQIPRFTSLLVRDMHGTEKWRKTELNMNNHIIIVNGDDSAGHRNKTTAATASVGVNAYLADLSVSNPLSLDKPLWEIHILVPYNCAILRAHHTLGDGTSIMSLLSACFQRVNTSEDLPITSRNQRSSTDETEARWSILDMLQRLWFTIVFMLQFLGRGLWVKDEETVVSGGDGVELWTRKLATASFSIDDMKRVKSALPNATVNDVLFGIVSIGLSRYLDLRTPKALPNGLHLTCMSMMNLRKVPGLHELTNMLKPMSKARWGNEFGIVLYPMKYHKAGSDPLQLMNRVKTMLDRKKQSLEAQFSYLYTNCITSIFGVKVASWFTYRMLCSTTFTMSNIAGPNEEMTFAGNLITSLRANITSLPHAITMHMVSYAGKAEMQILVAQDIIPDPEVLAKCFEDALEEIKDAAAVVEGKLQNCSEVCESEARQLTLRLRSPVKIFTYSPILDRSKMGKGMSFWIDPK